MADINTQGSYAPGNSWNVLENYNLLTEITRILQPTPSKLYGHRKFAYSISGGNEHTKVIKRMFEGAIVFVWPPLKNH